MHFSKEDGMASRISLLIMLRSGPTNLHMAYRSSCLDTATVQAKFLVEICQGLLPGEAALYSDWFVHMPI